MLFCIVCNWVHPTIEVHRHIGKQHTQCHSFHAKRNPLSAPSHQKTLGNNLFFPFVCLFDYYKQQIDFWMARNKKDNFLQRFFPVGGKRRVVENQFVVGKLISFQITFVPKLTRFFFFIIMATFRKRNCVAIIVDLSYAFCFYSSFSFV